MTHLAHPDSSHPRPSTTPARPRTAVPVNPVLLHDDIVRPELCNDVILAGARPRHSAVRHDLGNLHATRRR